MEMHTHIHLRHQVEEIVQWIESVMYCKTKQKKVKVFSLGKKSNLSHNTCEAV